MNLEGKRDCRRGNEARDGFNANIVYACMNIK